MVAIFTRYFAKGVLSKPLPDLGNRLNSCSKSGTSRCCSSVDGSARDGASSLATERTTVYMLELKEYMDYASSYSHVIIIQYAV